MLDTLSVAQELTAGGIDGDQAEVIANAMRRIAQQGDHVTADQFKVGLAEVRTEMAEVRAELRTETGSIRTEIAEVRIELRTETGSIRTEIANLETRLIRWMVGTVLATAALTFGILRFLTE